MAEQEKRQELEKYVCARARSDPDFRKRLLADPRTVIEAEIGMKFPDSVVIHVHEESLNELHLVLPVVFRLLTELEDEDLAGVVGGIGFQAPAETPPPLPRLNWTRP
ncbi:MAG: NHLP leader peptide family RiPP precursor [Acidobacteriota bacterium]